MVCGSQILLVKTRPYRMREDTRNHFNRFLLKKVSAYGFKLRRVGDCC